ncbi:hypothetical protein P879_01950 [Paragonimus westermani]|uniref:Uncharacterized protein n=1 Tax=Paragonimus westermani TaxID=34504 RepID=A0A8T0DW90_9TREM|nr:hypothetical protein P879_01950 [Paragonimus westermani]
MSYWAFGSRLFLLSPFTGLSLEPPTSKERCSPVTPRCTKRPIAMRGTSKAAIYRYRKRLLQQMPCCCSPSFSMWDHRRGCPKPELSSEHCCADVSHLLTDSPVEIVPVAGTSTTVSVVERPVARKRTSRRLRRTWERYVAVDRRRSIKKALAFCFQRSHTRMIHQSMFPGVLSMHHPTHPRDPRTLMGTPRDCPNKVPVRYSSDEDYDSQKDHQKKDTSRQDTYVYPIPPLPVLPQPTMSNPPRRSPIAGPSTTPSPVLNEIPPLLVPEAAAVHSTFYASRSDIQSPLFARMTVNASSSDHSDCMCSSSPRCHLHPTEIRRHFRWRNSRAHAALVQECA